MDRLEKWWEDLAVLFIHYIPSLQKMSKCNLNVKTWKSRLLPFSLLEASSTQVWWQKKISHFSNNAELLKKWRLSPLCNLYPRREKSATFISSISSEPFSWGHCEHVTLKQTCSHQTNKFSDYIVCLLTSWTEIFSSRKQQSRKLNHRCAFPLYTNHLLIKTMHNSHEWTPPCCIQSWSTCKWIKRFHSILTTL